MTDGDSEVVLKPHEQGLLNAVETQSPQNFRNLQDRLFAFYHDSLRDDFIKKGELTTDATEEDLRRKYDLLSNPQNLKIDDLRLVKAFNAFSIVKPEDIAQWVPETIRSEMLAELQKPNMSDRSDAYFAYNTLFGLIELLSDHGLFSAPDPRSGISGGTTSASRKMFEERLAQIASEPVYPNYAVVEKQETDGGSK